MFVQNVVHSILAKGATKVISLYLCLFLGSCGEIGQGSNVGSGVSASKLAAAPLGERASDAYVVLNGTSDNTVLAASVGPLSTTAIDAPASSQGSTIVASVVTPLVTPSSTPVITPIVSVPIDINNSVTTGTTVTPPTVSDPQIAQSNPEVTQTLPIPVTTPKSIPNPANVVKIVTAKDDLLGASPVDFARIFKRGEIFGSPELRVQGQPLLVQQSMVKSRWPDGSVKHAIFSATMPSAGAHQVTFIDGPIIKFAATAFDSARLTALLGGFDIQADLRSSTGAVASIKLSDFVAANAVDKVWIDGPQMIQFVMADHSVKRQFDIGFDQFRSLRPIFHVTVWPKTGHVRARLIVESSNTEALQDQSYSVDVFRTGNTPQLLMRESQKVHPLGSRWTREFFNKPRPLASIDHGLAYLASSGAIANYDPAIKIPTSALQQWASSWSAAPKSLWASGNWVKYMPTTGGRHDIGILPTWTLLWLYTGDPALYQMNYGNAELAASWPMHFREGKAGAVFDRKSAVPALGRVVTPDSRPSLFLAAGNAFINYDYTNFTDKLKVVGANAGGEGWFADVAHQADPFSALYMLTGDFWLLEQMWFWSSWNSFTGAIGGAPRHDSRGPNPWSAGIVDQTRGEAWGLRTRATTAFLSPDDSDEKRYFWRVTVEALTMWEGTRSMPSSYKSSQEYQWGQTIGASRYLIYGNRNAVPLNHWDFGNDRAVVSSGFDGKTVKAAISPWQQHFLIVAIGRAGDMGFDVSNLLRWNATYFESTFTSGVKAAPWLLGGYAYPLVDSLSGSYYPTWGATIAAMGTVADRAESDFRTNLTSIDSGYGHFASAASAYLSPFYSSRVAENFFRDNVRKVSDYSSNPKWAMVPR